MTLQFFKITGTATKASEFHKKLAEAAYEALNPDVEEDDGEEENDAQGEFLSAYRAAFKKGLSDLSLFLIQQGKPLLENDQNNYYNYLFCLGIFVAEAADEAAQKQLVTDILQYLKAELPEHNGARIKILSYLFTSVPASSLLRLTIFEEIISVCEANKTEFLYLAYVSTLGKILPLAQAPIDQLMALHIRLIKTLREKERYADLTRIIVGLFEELTRRGEESLKFKSTLCQFLCLMILNEEAIFQVEDLLCSKIVLKISESDPNLRESWTMFTTGNLSQANDFFTTNQAHLKEHNITLEIVKDRMRYFRISQIADSHQHIQTEELAKLIELPVGEVEFFLIKAIQYGYISALIDQLAQTVYFKEINMRNLKVRGKKEYDEKLDTVFQNLKSAFAGSASD